MLPFICTFGYVNRKLAKSDGRTKIYALHLLIKIFMFNLLFSILQMLFRHHAQSLPANKKRTHIEMAL